MYIAYVSAKEQENLPPLGRASTPEQLDECEELNIPVYQCSEERILEQRSSGLNRNPNPPQPNPLLNSDMLVIIGILGAIFGGLATIFLAKIRRPVEL